MQQKMTPDFQQMDTIRGQPDDESRKDHAGKRRRPIERRLYNKQVGLKGEHIIMKFSEMSYKRPDPEKIIAEIKEATEKLKNARSYEEARAAFLEAEDRSKASETTATLAYIRQSIDTRDEFYSREKANADAALCRAVRRCKF